MQTMFVACSATDEIFIPILPKVKGPSWKLEQKDCKSQNVGKTRAKQCLLDIAEPQQS